MPAAFEACRKAGGRIRTVKPSKETYMPVCIKGGKSHAGEVKHVKGDWPVSVHAEPKNDHCSIYNKCR